MKKKLLLLGATMLLSISASAQEFTATWEKPAPPTFSTWQEETEFYLWNVGAGGFYTCYQEGGNNAPYWNTRASVNDTFGNPVKFTRFNPSGRDESEIFSWCDANGYPDMYLLTSYVNTRGYNRFMCTFADAWNTIWTDNDGRQDLYWHVTKTGNYIKIDGGPKDIMYSAEARDAETEENPLFDYVGKYLGVRENDKDRVLYLYDTSEGRIGTDEAFYDEWAVVEAADYEAYMENSKDQALKVAAAATLRAAIEKAYVDVYDINLEAQIAVYNNTSSTLEELQAATAYVKAKAALGADIQKTLDENPGIDLSTITAVYENTASAIADFEAAQKAIIPIILDFNAKNATPDNPVNFTASIENATFDVVGDFHGWKGTAFGAGGAASTSAEHYGHSFDSYQDIDLTGYPGVYEVKVKGYVRKHNSQNSWDLYEAGQEDSEGFLYISSPSFGEMTTPIKDISVGAVDVNPNTGESEVMDALGQYHYVPNTMVSATSSFFPVEGTPYQVSVINAVKDGETLRIGVRNQSMAGDDWANFDDFELWYYGNSAAAYTAIKETLLETASLNIPEDAHYGQPDLDAFNQAVDALKAAADAEAIAAAVKAVDEAKKNFEKSKTAYAAYLEQIQSAEKWLLGSNAAGDDADKLADYLQTSAIDNEDMADYEFPNGVANFIIDLEHGAVAGKLSAADIETETAYLSVLLQTAIRNSMVPGQDVTYLLKNPKFDGNFDGWTYKAGKLGNHNVECFQSVVDVYQIVEGVPAGIYAISAQAFERPGGNGSFNGTEEPRVFLFMNEFKTPVQNICADGITNDKAVDKVNCLIGDGSGNWPNDYYQNDEVGWIPNSVDGAYYAFNSGRYDQECYGLVGDDGVMKIGLTSNGKTIEWVLWANFRLTYMGKDKTAMQSIIADFSERVVTINNQISAGDIVVGDPEMGALETAKTEALKAKDDETMYQALMTLVSAYNAVLTSADLYKEVSSLTDYYLDKIYNSELVGSYEAVEAVYNYYDGTFQNIYNNHTMSIAEVQKAIETMADLYAEALIPSDIDEATPDNPKKLDIIANATFDNAVSNNDFSGWTRLGGTKGFGVGGDVANSAEVWYGSFDICQDVKVVRTGTYMLTVNGMTRVATNSTNYTAWKNGEPTTAYFYAKTKTTQVSCNVKNVCDGAMPTDELGGVQLGTDEEPCYVPNSMAVFNNYIHGDDEWSPRVDEEGKPVYAYRNELFINVTDEDDDMIIRIGVKKDTEVSDDWSIFDDFEIWYLGKDGAANSEDALPVESINASGSSTVVGVYTVGGTRVASLQRGINIVRMSDGSVRKIIVK